MDATTDTSIVQFLTHNERCKLRGVCRRWHFTCTWLQFADEALQPPKSVWNLGSRQFRHAWQTFLKAKCAHFLPELLLLLPVILEEDTNELKRGLCASTNTGVRPSFDNRHARSGYIRSKINRCGNLPNLLLTEELGDIRSNLFRHGKKQWKITLYGGGPGFDTIGLVFLREFLRADDIAFHTVVYDNEPGWASAITGVKQTMDQLHFTNVSWDFKLCDITEDISTPVNASVLLEASTTQLFIFSFVCVENFCLLRDSRFAFLRSLFTIADIGSYFIFTDSTHRLWPAIYEIAVSVAPNQFRIWTPFVRSCHYALILQKLPTHGRKPQEFPFYSQAMDKLELFRRHQVDHLKTTSNQIVVETAL